MERFSRQWFGSALLLSVAVGVSGEPVPPSRTILTEAVQLALSHSPQMKEATAQEKASRAAVSFARSLQWPGISARSALTRSDEPVYVFGSLLDQGRFQSEHFDVGFLNNPPYLTNIKSALDLSLPLFQAFQIDTQKKISRIAQTEAAHATTGLAQHIRLQTVETVLSILQTRDLLRELDARLASADKAIADAERLRRKGLVLGSDFFAAEAIRSGLQARRAQVSNQMEVLLAALRVSTGRTWQMEDFRQFTLANTPYPLGESAAWIERAQKNRPEIQQAALQAQAAALSGKQARRSLLPDIRAFGSLETDTKDFSSNPTHRLVGLRASVPIGDPTYGPRTSQADSRFQALSARRDHLADQIQVETTRAWRALKGATDSLPLAKRACDQAAESLRLFQPLYREGRQSILDVLHAEEGLFQAQAAYLDTLFALHAGYARLCAAAGELADSSLQQIQSRLAGAL